MRNFLRVFFVFGLLATIGSAEARMYQWVDPQSGTSYLSGEPPSWYRARQPGPRVLVIEDGKVVDDTEWAATAEREKALRQQALIDHEKRKKAEEDRRAEEARLAAEKAHEQGAQEDAAAPKSREDELQVMRRLVRLYLEQNGNNSEADTPAE